MLISRFLLKSHFGVRLGNEMPVSGESAIGLGLRCLIFYESDKTSHSQLRLQTSTLVFSYFKIRLHCLSLFSIPYPDLDFWDLGFSILTSDSDVGAPVFRLRYVSSEVVLLTPTRGPSFFDSDSIFVQFFWIPPPHPLCHTDVKHFLLKMLLLQGESVGVFPPRWAHPYSSTEKLWLALEKRLKK